MSSAIEVFTIGTDVKVQFTTRDVAGTLADASAIVFEVTPRDGVVSAYTLSDFNHPSTGVYYIVISATQEGDYNYYFKATVGGWNFAENNRFFVRGKTS